MKFPPQLKELPSAIATGLGPTSNNSDPTKNGMGPRPMPYTTMYASTIAMLRFLMPLDSGDCKKIGLKTIFFRLNMGINWTTQGRLTHGISDGNAKSGHANYATDATREK